MEVSCQLHAPAALPPGKEPIVHIGQEAGWALSRSGRGGEEKNSQLLPRLEPPIIDDYHWRRRIVRNNSAFTLSRNLPEEAVKRTEISFSVARSSIEVRTGDFSNSEKKNNDNTMMRVRSEFLKVFSDLVLSTIK
jgi:hypothetical protein